MNMQYPKFAKSFCESFTACGELQGADEELSKLLKQNNEPMIIRYRAEGALAAVRFITGGKNDSHVHFDVSLPQWFRRKPPEATHKRSDIDRVVSHLEGMEISVHISAYLKANKAEVSSPIFSMLEPHEFSSDDEPINGRYKFTGVEFEQLGTGFDKLSIFERGKQYAFRFELEHETKINDAYLNSISQLIDTLFQTMFNIGEHND